MNKKYLLVIIISIIVFFISAVFFLWRWETDKKLFANQIKGFQEDKDNYEKEKNVLKTENENLKADNEIIKAENETTKAESEYLKGKKGENLSADEAAGKVINYTNKNLLSPGTVATIVSVSDEEALYRVRIKVAAQEFDTFITKDGKNFFPQGFKLEEETVRQVQNKTTCEDLKKTDEAFLEAFIVSNCPYGLQMQRILNEIVKDIPSLAGYAEVRYIGAIQNGKITSMHGDKEAQENLRQICIREEQNSKYWDYVACYMKKGETDNCLISANIDRVELASCIDINSRGLEYAKDDFDLQNELGVTGSPTLFLNREKVSEFDFGGRTAEAVKTLFCCGFNVKPANCSKKLTEISAAAGFSETYASSSGGSSAGGCDQ